MPVYPPRQESIKKRDQLLQREKEMQLAIKSNVTDEKIAKLAGKYRLAQLSFLKAKLHELLEKTYQKKTSTLKQEKIETEILEWTDKTNEQVVNEIKTKLK